MTAAHLQQEESLHSCTNTQSLWNVMIKNFNIDVSLPAVEYTKTPGAVVQGHVFACLLISSLDFEHWPWKESKAHYADGGE